jgi:hypothetical protein
MAKPKPLRMAKEPMAEKAEKKEEQQKPKDEPTPKEAQKPSEEQFDWSGFLVPNADKIIRFLLIACISVAAFAAFVSFRNISQQSISVALWDPKTLLFILTCYFFACYTVAKRINILYTAVAVLLPEVGIILYLLSKLPQKPPV